MAEKAQNNKRITDKPGRYGNAHAAPACFTITGLDRIHRALYNGCDREVKIIKQGELLFEKHPLYNGDCRLTGRSAGNGQTSRHQAIEVNNVQEEKQ